MRTSAQKEMLFDPAKQPRTPDDPAAARLRYREFLRSQRVEQAAGAPPFRLTLSHVRAAWPQWAAARNEEREKGRRTVMEKYGDGAGALAHFLVDVHLPELPSPSVVVVNALDLECGHEDVWLAKRDDDSAAPPERWECPIYWHCRLSHGRTVVRYLEPAEPKPRWADLGLRRRSARLACGHNGEVLRLEHAGEDLESRAGDHLMCTTCDLDVEIVAVGELLPDPMDQDWTVDLSCGHRGTDYHVPVEAHDNPAAHRAEGLDPRGFACYASECREREVRGVRRLGVLGRKPPEPKLATPRPDPVERAASDLRRRLTQEERWALIRRLQEVED